MDQVRQIVAYVGAQLGRLTVTQRLLIASLAVVMLMTLFLVSQYAGAPEYVDLIPTGTPEDQKRAAEFLDKAGVDYKMRAAKVTVPPERKYPAIAQLAKAQLLPNDKRLMFGNLASQQSWMMSSTQLAQMYTSALTNELASVMKNFPGIEDASVFVSNPEAKGLGASFRKPVAQVTVFPRTGTMLDQGTVNTLADMVAGAVAGLETRDVAIVDGTNKRSHRAISPEDFYASSYVEQVAKVESRVQEKIHEHLRFIQDVIVSVNALVDGAQRKTVETRVLGKGEGTVSLPAEETTTTITSSGGGKGGAEPGLASNVGMDVSHGGSGAGGGGPASNEESATNKFENRFGEKAITQLDARGRPTKINVTISVPRDYVVQVVKQKKSGAGAAAGSGQAASEPTEDEIQKAWDAADGVKVVVEGLVAPLVETEGKDGSAAAVGTVRAFLIPVAMASASIGGPSRVGGILGGGGGGGSMLTDAGALLGSNTVKTVSLGGLALLSVGLMVMMVRKAGRVTALPTAEELVGIPPALEPGSDVVGEADETDTAMVGIEVDPDRLRTSKMLEEVQQLVKSNPPAAAGVFNRWLSSDV